MNSKILPSTLLLFFSLALSSAPAADRPGRKFSTMERLQEPHLKAVHDARAEWSQLAAQNLATNKMRGTGIYNDYRAVIHVHAEDSNHTGGKRPEVLAAAKKTGVQVVLFTDHRGPKPETWRGLRDGVLFIAGSEESDRLRFPLFENEKISREDLNFICHIEERYDMPRDGFDGMEIYNRHTDTKDDDDFNAGFAKLMQEKQAWAAFVELYKKYPDEIFGAGTDYWPEIFAKWHKETKGSKPFTGIGANDAHQNQVFNGLMLDPYEVSFRNLSTHILARELTEDSIRQSLKEGHVYVSHDWLCETTGFNFIAQNNFGVFAMGDPVLLVGTTRLISTTPIPAKIKLFHNGLLKEEKTGDRVTFETKTEGTYRIEAWLQVDGEERPWIYSNPVYLKQPDLLSMDLLPNMELKTNVQLRANLIYTDGPEDQESKHKLDIYSPKGKEKSPVFFFIHGGAWTSGDRSQYPPLGNRYASEGIVTVVPSYRLAPKYPFPAQIEDTAAAFAWTVRHISEFGGDTNRIYVGGHSAGGHLAALLTLDPAHLAKHNLTPDLIKGVMCLSGVYDMTEGKDNVFGRDPQLRHNASPINYTHKTPFPYLVTYCEWDYFPLAIQAKDFTAALQKSGAPAKLIYVPKESHISEMLSVSKPSDLTARSIVELIKP
jgi:acetyl esterase/lipase